MWIEPPFGPIPFIDKRETGVAHRRIERICCPFALPVEGLQKAVCHLAFLRALMPSAPLLLGQLLGFVSKHYVRQILRSMCWMKAIRIMPPKLIAVFSKREKMRRLSFSQPIRRSMMLRSR